jgi:hypothetical protein
MAFRILKQGSSGEDVRTWQNFLVGQDLLEGEVDGVFGPKTVEATKAFQTKNSLDDDGQVGPKTFGTAVAQGLPAMEDDNDENGPNWPQPTLSPVFGSKLVGSFKYEAAPTSGNPEGIKFTDNWPSNNIIQVEIPQLKGIEGAPSNGKISFHKLGATQLKNLWQAWEDEGLIHLVKSWAGSWNPRFVRGSRTYLSNHAYGTAFDINAPWNWLGQVPALKGKEGSVRELVPLANQHGFYWGGFFDSRKDGMHFELAKIIVE